MTLCSYGHEEVCYESRYCPACAMKEERDDLRRDLDKAQSKIENLEDEIETLGAQAATEE